VQPRPAGTGVAQVAGWGVQPGGGALIRPG
jgi:hypothetical protein